MAIPIFKCRKKIIVPDGGVSSEERYAKAKTAQWLDRLAQRDIAPDSSFFACLDWCLDGLEHILHPLQKEVATLPRRQSPAKAGKALRQIVEGSAHCQDDGLEAFLKEYPSMRPMAMRVVRQECLALAKKHGRFSGAPLQATRRLRRVFGISAESASFCEFVFLLQTFHPVERYYEDSLSLHRYASRYLLAAILNMDVLGLKRCIDESASCGLLCNYDPGDTFRLRDELRQFWEGSDRAGNMFCAPLAGKALALDRFRIPAEELNHVKALLARPARAGDGPTHILLYGPPGTGKSTLAASLAAALKVQAWRVISRKDDDDDDRRASLTACLHMASRHPGSFVLVDEAERMLDTNNTFVKTNKDKAWLNDFLETPGRRVIWITNHIGHIEQSVRRRFQYSLSFERLNNTERKELWRQILAERKAARLLPGESLDALAEKYDVPAAVIEESVSQAKSVYRTRAAFGPAVERIVRAYVTLREDGKKPRPENRTAPGYTAQGVCLEGSVDGLLEQCRRVDARLRAGAPIPSGAATMLFYGPPGTGKTALARHIAETLDRGCLIRRPSDLLSMWLGESEKNIAGAFQQAEADGAVLVIDEADSFLYGREMSQHSWETTQVNEFLTCLEECRGFCICTTNRRENLDMAAMRRFSFKIPFNYSGRKQVEALYAAVLAPLAKATLTAEDRRGLLSLTRLTPGDFHAVRARYWLAEPQSVSHAELTDCLRREQQMKLERTDRRIGF